MPNKQQQTQHLGQETVQRQKLTQQQLQVVRLIELPLTSLEERVKNEVIENIALEEGRSDTDGPNDPIINGGDTDNGDGVTTEDDPEGYNREEMMKALGMDEGRANDYSTEDIPPNIATKSNGTNFEVPIGDTGSFIEDLLAQIGEYDVDENTRFLLEYLVGSLNKNGFIDKPLDEMADEIVIYHNRDVDAKDLKRALAILQQFDPPGIGARDLRESLILQIDRKLSLLPKTAEEKPRRALLELERRVLTDYFRAFVNKNYDKIMDALDLSPAEMQAVQEGITHLDPHPGIALNESSADRVMTIIPDFIIETEEDEIHMYLNEGFLPPLHINRQFIDDLRNLEKRKKELRTFEKEKYTFLKENVDKASMFIDAINQRRHTLYVTMKAIIELQKEFFFTQDDDQLKPMILQDVANRAHLDISTVSRVCNSKYCVIDGNVYSLKYFFERIRTNADGEGINIKEVKRAIQVLIDAEDKSKPLSDDAITKMLNDKGYNIKRRTLAKYRDQMKIPTSKLRKEITK